MKKSTTGLLIGSALVVGLSGCASSASQSSGQASASSDRSWYQHPAVCGLAGGLIGGGIGYGVSGRSDEESGAATGAAAGAAIGALLCADRTPEPVEPQCPTYGEVPAGVATDAQGCPLDSDNDGVPDYRDQCPGTPAGVQVDAVGCPLDSDNDGVPDYRDQCPNTPAGVEVNALGCEESVVLQNVNFEFDSARLTPGAQQVLNGVAERLVNNQGVRVSIAGHTDSVGSDQYNMQLSQERAESVARYLNQRGVPASDMRAVGYGEERPIATNDTDAGRAQNRRVELDEWN
ncbi:MULTISPECIES: OmpA family protein [unclassified Halomonas]|uniref:OmpA family protein n=1 Tax=unclassified Halomonas TaxID=2609666 RepID=UPI0021E368D0|nr:MULTISPECIES: OmpA family protein [unclassified Halomonas]UYG01448.1 OmpA family protein [Halomonas sp. GD1P12]WNL37495.1 OmpA family protein [Halomonas sp. PAMB 3232]WNL40808.1 OmpA family protein [Halomonas sp. PAMB 3264]